MVRVCLALTRGDRIPFQGRRTGSQAIPGLFEERRYRGSESHCVRQ